MNKQLTTYSLLTALAISACSEDMLKTTGQDTAGLGTIRLTGEINQVATTRVNDEGFADGDVMGVYIVDYEGNNPGTLLSKGNRGDNVRHTFDEAAYRWNSAYDLYWKDKHTRIDVYGYYPFASPDDVNNYKFTVKTNQATVPGDGTMGDYEASDFLWGKVEGVEPTSSVIRLPMTHRMANARVTLTEGSGFADGEWSETSKEVLVRNTVRDALIDLATGIVKPDGEVSTTSIIPSKKGDEWRAIVVPQTISAGTTLFNITIGGIPYRFSKGEEFTYVAGKMSNFTIRVDKKELTGDFTLTLVSESITAWESDLVSHDATSKEYVIVESTPGGLKQAITDAGKDYKKLKNLKITGEVDSRDFYFMRDEMDALQALNLKEVKIKAFGNEPIYNLACNEDQIPPSAFYYNSTISGKHSLLRLILPDKLKSIGARAFYGCKNISGSLIIPEGVIDIQQGAFQDCRSLTGSLSLPSTLKYIGNAQHDNGEFSEDKDEGIDYYGGTFANCGFTCELVIPDNVELIRGYAFDGCRGFYGSLRLPEKLRRIGSHAFASCQNIKGSLEIPQGLTDIPSNAFQNCGFDGTLTLHDGIATIGEDAFSGCHFRGELALPKDLAVVSDGVFYGCDFSGELVLPTSLVTIGEFAFAYNWRLMGTLEFAEGLITIGAGAFAHCRSLEGLVFPESLENIRYFANYYDNGGAFEGCYGIGKIVSKSEIPPYIQEGALNGIAKDNFTVEVPESAVAQYQTAVGWCDFKRISAHHELVCRPAVACALSTEHKQTLVIDAEGDWELDSKPDWCELSKNSGNKKSEIILTIKSTAAGHTREGDVVFRLKGKDYTHSCHVTQYGYEYGEDEFLTLQKATKGNNGGINIVIMGDGYDAKDIATGEYLKDMKQQVEYFFGIEPYTTYRDYFNVYTAFPLSTETGIGTVNSIRYNRFSTTYTGGVGLKCDYDEVFRYVVNGTNTVTNDNLDQTLIIIVPNSTDYGGICQMWESGAAIAFCPKSDYGYPLDSRGVIQHEAGGHGFGKLADEYIYHNAFIDACGCTCCGHADAINWAKSLGWYDNVELTGKMHEVGWSHLIFDPRYSDIVDIFEGGYMHNRGVFRSEQNSCMNNDIPYYSTISRQSIVKRIKAYAGETFDFEEFVTLDKRTAGYATRSFDGSSANAGQKSLPPVIHKGSPLK